MKIKILALVLIFGLSLTFMSYDTNAQTPIKKKPSTTTTTTTTTTTNEAPAPVKKADATKAAAKTTTAKTAKPMKGQIVSFNDLVMGGKGKVSKDEAVKLADAGNPIVFQVGKKIYFVYNEDGTFAGKKLAKYAANEFVGIVGKAKTVNGINIIIMTMIDSM